MVDFFRVAVRSEVEGCGEAAFELQGVGQVADVAEDAVGGRSFGIGGFELGESGLKAGGVGPGDYHGRAAFETGFGGGEADSGGAAQEEDAGFGELGVFEGGHCGELWRRRWVEGCYCVKAGLGRGSKREGIGSFV